MCTRRTLKLTNDPAKVSEHTSEPGKGPRSPVPTSAPVRAMVSASFTLVGRCSAVVRFSCAYLFPSGGWGGVMPSLGVLPCSLEQPAWSGLCPWGGQSSEAPQLTAGPNNVACDFWPGLRGRGGGLCPGPPGMMPHPAWAPGHGRRWEGSSCQAAGSAREMLAGRGGLGMLS